MGGFLCLKGSLTAAVPTGGWGWGNRKEKIGSRAKPKTPRHSDRRLRRFAEEIEAQIDCTQCANCCRVTEVPLIDRDIEKLMSFLGASKEEFLRDYTQRAEDGDLILKRTEPGCVFLQGNLCSVYEARPQNCANFPHLVRG